MSKMLRDDLNDDNLGMGPLRIASPSGLTGVMGIPPISRKPYEEPAAVRPAMGGSPAPPTVDQTPFGAPAKPQNPHVAEIQRMEDTGSGVQQVQQKHPFWGGVLRGLDVAGSIIAPQFMSAIPGTTIHHNALINREEGLANQDVAREKTQATTGLEQAEAERVSHPKPQLEMTEQGLVRVPEEGEATPVTAGGQPLTKPTVEKQDSLANEYHDAVMDAIKRNVNPQDDPRVQQIGDAITSLQRQAPEAQAVHDYNQWLKDNNLQDTSANKFKFDSLASAAKQAPQRAPIIPIIIPSPNGGGTLAQLRPGQTVPEGAMSPNQYGSVNEANAKPTMQMRNVAAQAQLVHEKIPGLIAEIKANATQLGPYMGRWNEVMQGTVGADNPTIAGLRADLLMASSAVALMHARGRLPENLRKEFDNAINAPKQTAGNLISTLQHIDDWTAKNIQTMGGQHGEQPGGNNSLKITRDANGKIIGVE